MLGYILFAVAFAVIAVLGVYAGRLLFLLKAQRTRQNSVREKRIASICQSIRTIAFAMDQQQCDPSEGAIRICNLLEAIPVSPQPDYASKYPGLFELYARIKHFPTHEARNALSKVERRKQDRDREQIESELASKVQKDISQLRTFMQ